MKRSWWPILVALVLCLVLWWRLPWAAAGGGFGPALHAGLYVATADAVAALPPEQLRVQMLPVPHFRPLLPTVRETGTVAETGPWQAVTVVAGDGHPITRSLILALAEALSQRRILVNILPEDAQAVPLPAIRLFRVACRAPIPQQPGDWQGRVAVALHDARPPDLDACAQPRIAERHRQWQAVVEAGADDIAWSAWYATVGRAMAAAVLAEWQVPELAADDLDLVASHGAWDGAGQLGVVPVPPGHRVLRWWGAWQEPRVRGWHGIILGHHRRDRQGAQQDTLATVDRHLQAAGWQLILDQEGRRQWHHPTATGMQELRADRREWGWVVDAWQLRPQPVVPLAIPEKTQPITDDR